MFSLYLFVYLNMGLKTRVFSCICSTLDGKHTGSRHAGWEPWRGAGRRPEPREENFGDYLPFASFLKMISKLTTLVASASRGSWMEGVKPQA